MPVTPASLRNLRPWQPGQSGNPAGRVPRKKMQDKMQKYLQDYMRMSDGTPVLQAEKKVRRMELVVQAQFRKAMKGDTRAASWLWEHAFGKAEAPTTIGNPDGTPLEPAPSQNIMKGMSLEQLEQIIVAARAVGLNPIAQALVDGGGVAPGAGAHAAAGDAGAGPAQDGLVCPD